jgi:chemotaxis protein methyltransferase WspC
MNVAPVIDLLRQRIGLEPDSLGATTLSRAVTARIRALRLTSGEDYVARLLRDGEEFQLLLADVAVPETWFFRGGQVFAYLAGQVTEIIRQRERGKTYRILSAPCSTGEEPYSLAIALVEAGAMPASWEIEALDVCARHLEAARGARFRNFSFRQTPSVLRDRYFHPVEGGWELDSRISSCVRFRPGNLADPIFLAGEEAFDLILCRNLFIYLTPGARRQALDTIARLLVADGWLCTGHADSLDHGDPRFERIGPGGYFLYRRTAECRDIAKGEEVVRWWGGEVVKGRQTITPSPSEGQTPEPARLLESAPAFAEDAAPVNLLQRAQRQADGGRLHDALDTCREQLARVGPSADLYSLMGVIHQARQEIDEAVHCYKRALYLDRAHPQALTHLMLLSQERGDGAQADRLRRRLERVAPGGHV